MSEILQDIALILKSFSASIYANALAVGVACKGYSSINITQDSKYIDFSFYCCINIRGHFLSKS